MRLKAIVGFLLLTVFAAHAAFSDSDVTSRYGVGGNEKTFQVRGDGTSLFTVDPQMGTPVWWSNAATTGNQGTSTIAVGTAVLSSPLDVRGWHDIGLQIWVTNPGVTFYSILLAVQVRGNNTNQAAGDSLTMQPWLPWRSGTANAQPIYNGTSINSVTTFAGADTVGMVGSVPGSGPEGETTSLPGSAVDGEFIVEIRAGDVHRGGYFYLIRNGVPFKASWMNVRVRPIGTRTAAGGTVTATALGFRTDVWGYVH